MAHDLSGVVLSNLHGPDNMTTIAIKSAGVRNDCATLDSAKVNAPEILEQLIHGAERAGASDIHLQMAGPVAQVALRLDGVMTPVSELPEEIAERVFGRIKFLARLKTYQESLPQDGRIDKAEIGRASCRERV